MPVRRGTWTGLILLAAVVAAVVAGALDREEDGPGTSGAGTDGIEGASSEEVRAEVLSVTDGDTIRVRLPDGEVESVRYIGIDTPESNPDVPLECFGPEAGDENERLVGGREVTLRFGPERRDRYDRLLAYVYLGDRFVNAELVERGFARTLTIAPNDGFAPLLRRLEDAAGRDGIGLWGACNR